MSTPVQRKERESNYVSGMIRTAAQRVQSKSSTKTNSVYTAQQTRTSQTAQTEGTAVERTSASSKRKKSGNVDGLLQRFNNNFPNFKFSRECKIKTLERISGMNIKELAKDNNAIDLVFRAIVQAIKELKGQKLTNNNIAETANKYFIAVKSGAWENVGEYRKHRADGKGKSLKATLDENQKSEKDFHKYMNKKYGNERGFFRKTMDFCYAVCQGKSEDDYTSEKAMKEMVDLINNSTKEQKFDLVEGIRVMRQSNKGDKNQRIKVLQMIYTSLSPKEQVEFSERFVNESELLRILGADATEETIQHGEHTTSSHMSQEQAVRHNKSINNNAAKIEKRIAELKAKKNLTGKETAELKSLEAKLSKQYTPLMVGNTTGSEANYNITDQKVLDEIIVNNTSHTNREDVMKGVAEYATNHSDEMRHTQEEFREMMNKATNGEYSEIENEVIAQAQNNSNSEGSSQTQSETSNREVQPDYENTNDYSERTVAAFEVNENSNSAVQTAQNTGVANGTSGTNYNERVSETSGYKNSPVSADTAETAQTTANEGLNTKKAPVKNIITFITKTLKENNKGSIEYQNAICTYKRGDSSTQVKVLASSDVSVFNTILEYTKEASIVKFQSAGYKGPDTYSTKEMEKRLQTLREKENKLNA